MKVFCRVLLIAAFAVAAFGCDRTMPVRDVEDTPVYVPAGSDGEDVIQKAILAGGKAKGWKMHQVGPGHIVGQVVVRQHKASVDVYYDSDSYTIQYKDSENLMYNGAEIHRNYNKWITLLDQQIQLHLPPK